MTTLLSFQWSGAVPLSRQSLYCERRLRLMGWGRSRRVSIGRLSGAGGRPVFVLRKARYKSNIVKGVSKLGWGGARGSSIGSGRGREFQTLSLRCWASTKAFLDLMHGVPSDHQEDWLIESRLVFGSYLFESTPMFWGEANVLGM